MSSWALNAAANLVSRSSSPYLAMAMREWHATGDLIDHHSIDEVCELCDHTGLRYHYEIRNTGTNSQLWVGSTCITRFVPMFEGGREVVDEAEKSAILLRWRKEAEELSREEAADRTLRKLFDIDPRFRTGNWKRDWKLGYSAKQLNMVAVVCRANGIPFSAYNFKINTRRERVVDQVKDLDLWHYKRIRLALPKSRVSELDAYFGYTPKKER